MLTKRNDRFRTVANAMFVPSTGVLNIDTTREYLGLPRNGALVHNT
jgi:hypothetical protein